MDSIENKKSIKLSFVFLLLFLVSLSFLLCKLYLRFTPKNIEFTNIPTQVYSSQTSVKPVGISVSTIGVWLPLIPSEINKSFWETTANGVSYWKNGVTPGESGNAILYGHNWGTLLGNLSKVKPGEAIDIYFENNTKKTFIVEFTQEVDPSDSSILKNTEDVRITLYTCSGFLDTKRFVVVAISKA